MWFGLLAPSAWAGTMKAGRVGNVVTIATTSPTQNEEVRMMIRSGNLTFVGGAFGTNTDVDADPGCTELATTTNVQCGSGPSVDRIVIRPGGGDDTFQTRTLAAGDVADVQAVIDAEMGPGDDACSSPTTLRRSPQSAATAATACRPGRRSTGSTAARATTGSAAAPGATSCWAARTSTTPSTARARTSR